MEDIILGLVLQMLAKFIKNPAHAAVFKDVLIHVRDEINILFPGA